jgi:hypothetical protein
VTHDYSAERLSALWVRQLYREYDHLVFRYRLKLKPPVIQVTDLASRLGQWDGLLRVLTISRRLIETHPWDLVLEILKHEMAHQMVDECLGGGGGHGPRFKLACERLGVAPWAASATGELPSEIPKWRDRSLSEEEERLLRRVEKLLALAASTNEHEAALAMQRVREIYDKYNLEQVRSARQATLVYSVITRKKQRMSRPEALIFSILAEHYFVRVVHGTTFEARDGREYAMAELLGTRENVLMAEYVYGFLWAQIHLLWDNFQARTKASGRKKSSYLIGVLIGFRDKLRRSQTELEQTAGRPSSRELTALVAVADREVEQFVKTRHPRLSTTGRTTLRGDEALFRAGRAEGEKLTLHRAVTEQRESGPLYLNR